MTESGHQEKEDVATDPVGAANDTNTEEPVATEPLQYVVSDGGSSSDQEKDDRPEATRTLTTTTTRSTLTAEQPDPEHGKKKPWYKRLNPLKGSKKPPVPKERIVSREYGASFLSLLTFQWMAPIMRVRDILHCLEDQTNLLPDWLPTASGVE